MNPLRIYVFVVAITLGWWGLAFSHEFEGDNPDQWSYPGACCDERDCRAVEPHEIEWTDEGWRFIATGQIIPHGSVPYGSDSGRAPRWSPNPSFHACFTASGAVRVYSYGQSPRPCFWEPMTGT